MKCQVCGSIVRNDYIFCPNCGSVLVLGKENFSNNIVIDNQGVLQKINNMSSRRSFYAKFFIVLVMFSIIFFFSFICFTFLMGRNYLAGGILGLFTWIFASFLSIIFSVIMLAIVRQVDLYEKEPWGLVIFAFLWGALGSTLFSLIANEVNSVIFSSVLGSNMGNVLSAIISAPLFEEFFKLLVIPIIIIFFRTNFNGPIDGLVYIFASSLGFKVVEDLLYGSKFVAQSGAIGGFFLLVLVRWIMGFLGHPLMSMFSGFAVGLATITENYALKVVYVFLGYLLSVFSHFMWNFMASVATNIVGPYACLWFPLQTTILLVIFIFLFFMALKIDRDNIRKVLEEEVANGFLDHQMIEEIFDFRLRNRRKSMLPNELRNLYDIFIQELASYALLKKQSANSLGNEINKELHEKREILQYIKPLIYA